MQLPFLIIFLLTYPPLAKILALILPFIRQSPLGTGLQITGAHLLWQPDKTQGTETDFLFFVNIFIHDCVVCIHVCFGLRSWTEIMTNYIIMKLTETFDWKIVVVQHFYIHFLFISVQQETWGLGLLGYQGLTAIKTHLCDIHPRSHHNIPRHASTSSKFSASKTAIFLLRSHLRTGIYA